MRSETTMNWLRPVIGLVVQPARTTTASDSARSMALILNRSFYEMDFQRAFAYANGAPWRTKSRISGPRPSGSTLPRRVSGCSPSARRGAAQSSRSSTGSGRSSRFLRRPLRQVGSLHAHGGPDRVLDVLEEHELELLTRLGGHVLQVLLVALGQHHGL